MSSKKKSSPSILVRHLRDYWGVPFATVIALGPKKIGCSICNTKDRFSKKKGVDLAIQSAISGQLPKVPNRRIWIRTEFLGLTDSNTINVVKDAITSMESRASKYFLKNKKNNNAINHSINSEALDSLMEDYDNNGLEKKCAGYVNIYTNQATSNPHKTRKDADNGAEMSGRLEERVACVKVMYNKGQFDN